MTALPPSTDFTAGTVTEGQFKTAMTALRDYLSGLFGTAGTQATALSTLGALLNGTLTKAANYTLAAADLGKMIDYTGTYTLTLLAAATAGDGFACGVRNSGTGVITIDPNSSELIDGASTITLAAGESCLLICNGTAWKTVGRPSLAIIGVGQTWQDVSASRAVGTTYTNSTGKPIAVLTSASGSGGTYSIDGVVSVYQNGTNIVPNTMIIPNNSTYRLDGLAIYSNYWFELR